MPLTAAPDLFDRASRAYLEALTGLSGQRLDSFLAQPDPEPVRLDGPKRCTVGISCGSTCISKGKECRVKANPRTVAKIRQLLALPAAGQSSSRGPSGAVAAPQRSAGGEGPGPAMSTTELKEAVLKSFKVNSTEELRRNGAFRMEYGEDEDPPSFKGKNAQEGWRKVYRQRVGVPRDERNLPDGGSVINGIDILKNFRPWHVFKLDPKTATAEDVDKAFRTLAKKHHPDVGGSRAVFERLVNMKESIKPFRPIPKQPKRKGTRS